MPPSSEISEHHTLAEAIKRFPRGLICLLSALRFHDLGSETPGQVWLALPREPPRPRVSDFPLRVVRYASLAMTTGIERHRIENVEVRVTTKPRTIVDCFRFRNQIGISTALEAFHSGFRQGVKPTEIRKMAETFRQANVMRPYMEALL